MVTLSTSYWINNSNIFFFSLDINVIFKMLWSLIIIIFMIIALVVLLGKFLPNQTERFDNNDSNLTYAGNRLIYVTDPRDQLFRFISHKDTVLYVPDADALVNKASYSINF